jgi:hypothetical protein
MGIRFLSREVGDYPTWAEISTVCLEGGHLEDPLGWCEPEHGYETMVFLDGCWFFSVFTQKYKTRKQAAMGHDSIIGRLLSGTLPLAIPLGYYSARESGEPGQSEGTDADATLPDGRA